MEIFRYDVIIVLMPWLFGIKEVKFERLLTKEGFKNLGYFWHPPNGPQHQTLQGFYSCPNKLVGEFLPKSDNEKYSKFLGERQKKFFNLKDLKDWGNVGEEGLRVYKSEQELYKSERCIFERGG